MKTKDKKGFTRKEFENVIKEFENYKKTGIPRCQICKKTMKHAIDSKTGKVSEYLWQTTCEHSKKLRLNIG